MLRFIGNQFRKPTGFFGKIISKLMQKGNGSAYDKIIPELEIKVFDKILEIGYGHGLGIKKIMTKYECFVTGIDFSTLMFEEATKRNKKHIDTEKVDLYFGDFLHSDINSNEYDGIYCLNVIYFWDNLIEPFTKIYRGLTEEGIFCTFMVHQDDLKKMKFTKDDIFNKYSIEQVVESLKLSGFEDVSYKFDNGYLIKCRK